MTRLRLLALLGGTLLMGACTPAWLAGHMRQEVSPPSCVGYGHGPLHCDGVGTSTTETSVFVCSPYPAPECDPNYQP